MLDDLNMNNSITKQIIFSDTAGGKYVKPPTLNTWPFSFLAPTVE